MAAPDGRDAAQPVARVAPLVSVVIPSFNAAHYIGRTLDSVLRQSHGNLEVIIVDDKSTDDTVRIVGELADRDPRIRLIRLPRNHGAPAAPRNAGVDAARGDWVAFLDADDLWHPRKLEVQMRALEEHDADMCSAQMKDFRREDEIVVADVPARPRVRRVTLRQQLLKYRTPTSSIVIRRELMVRCRFNEDLSYKAREDTDCFIRVHEHMPFSIKIAHPLVYYRQQASQISGNKRKMVGRHLEMLKRYRFLSGQGMGWMAYVYTATHFAAAVYLRWIRRTL